MRWILCFCLVACARNSGVKETDGDVACEGLDETSCLFPFPSDYFRKDGALAFTERSMPRNADQKRFSPDAFAARDGFSAVTPIYFRLPSATLDGAPTVDDIARSLEVQAKTLIVDAETKEPVAHWAEFDHFSLASEPVIALRLAQKLMYGKRYIVAVRGLAGATPSRGFVALRDGTKSVVAGIDARREHFVANVFRPLEMAGVRRKDLQLAFDFTVGSEASATRDMYATIERGLAALPAGGPAYTVNNVETYDDGPIAKMIQGTLFVPSVLEPGTDAALRKLNRGDDGLPRADGFEAIAFDLQIPRSATAPAGVIQYGHGLLGRRAEAYGAWIREMAERHNFLILDLDMQGMSQADLSIWLDTFRDHVETLPLLADKVHQGVLNHVVATRMLKTSFRNEPIYGALYDPSRIYYYGNSQGGTMGALITTVHPDISRSVLGVPGGAFAFLLSRSVDFSSFATVVQSQYPDTGDFLAIMGLVQTAFDRMDPINYAQHLTEAHSALLHVAKEDAQVDNQVSELLARVIGAKLLEPAVKPVFGLDSVQAPYAGTAYVEYDFKKPERPATNAPVPKENDTHETLRRHALAQDQLWQFLETGTVSHLCSGVCDPD